MRRDIVDEVLDDHQELHALFHELAHADDQARSALFRYLLARLAAHEAAEALLVHRTVRDHVPGGAAIADAASDEEAAIEQRMAVLVDFDPSSEEFARQLHCLQQHVLRHTGYEEREELPRLREHLDSATLEALGHRFARTRRLGPTRPHPTSPAGHDALEDLGPIVVIWNQTQHEIHELISC
jgi:hypothetical protein